MRYNVWCPEDDEQRADCCQIDAIDAKSAAEAWAEQDDYASAEYRIVAQRSTPVVHVAEVGSDVVTRWRVRGESVAVYYAEALPGPERAVGP